MRKVICGIVCLAVLFLAACSQERAVQKRWQPLRDDAAAAQDEMREDIREK